MGDDIIGCLVGNAYHASLIWRLIFVDWVVLPIAPPAISVSIVRDKYFKTSLAKYVIDTVDGQTIAWTFAQPVDIVNMAHVFSQCWTRLTSIGCCPPADEASCDSLNLQVHYVICTYTFYSTSDRSNDWNVSWAEQSYVGVSRIWIRDHQQPSRCQNMWLATLQKGGLSLVNKIRSQTRQLQLDGCICRWWSKRFVWRNRLKVWNVFCFHMGVWTWWMDLTCSFLLSQCCFGVSLLIQIVVSPIFYL